MCGAMQVGECAQLVYQLFRMHPAERLPANGELASVIADNHYLAQHLMCLDLPPHRPFVGGTDWIRCDLRCPVVEAPNCLGLFGHGGLERLHLGVNCRGGSGSRSSSSGIASLNLRCQQRARDR
jgi:hypothetical protein